MQICKFFADSKSRAQELSNDVSFVIFGHKTWNLEGGVKLTPPPHILVFKDPSRDRVKRKMKNKPILFIINISRSFYGIFDNSDMKIGEESKSEKNQINFTFNIN